MSTATGEGGNLEEVSEGEKIYIFYSTGQICLLWPLARACPLMMLSPLLPPLLALAWGLPWEGSVSGPSAAGTAPARCFSPTLISRYCTQTAGPGKAAAMTRLCCRSRDFAESKLKIQAGGRGGGCAAFPAAPPVLFTPARSAP